MMQFGYIYEQGRLEITDYPYQFNDTYTIKTLEKDEIEKRWDEIIGMIESNSESDVFAFHSTKSVNVGEIYVMPK